MHTLNQSKRTKRWLRTHNLLAQRFRLRRELLAAFAAIADSDPPPQMLPCPLRRIGPGHYAVGTSIKVRRCVDSDRGWIVIKKREPYDDFVDTLPQAQNLIRAAYPGTLENLARESRRAGDAAGTP